MTSDARYEQWEKACRCKTYDVRMCSCDAGFALTCEGCHAGVMLPKESRYGNMFWGCSNYKKGGCKHTMKWGPPHDKAARQSLERRNEAVRREKEAERIQLGMIQDPFELQWRHDCRCDGAKHLNTFECYMRSSGGCGMLPPCPNHCGGVLFLKESRYGKGMWWGCSGYKKYGCKFSQDYIEHELPSSGKTELSGQKKRSSVDKTATKDTTTETSKEDEVSNKKAKTDVSD